MRKRHAWPFPLLNLKVWETRVSGPPHTPHPLGLKPMAQATCPSSSTRYLLQQWNQGPPWAWWGLPWSASAQSQRPWAHEARPMQWFQHLVTAG